jgi:hypothetical protein
MRIWSVDAHSNWCTEGGSVLAKGQLELLQTFFGDILKRISEAVVCGGATALVVTRRLLG